ncbi:hypothetical protein O181_102523 [Austropuccinia psidii MF-1]|uniref:Uncharacterized protein n=1 Tax=Austropuccinia psidii MF-1 TaxID=1389203 RepID=A0A9Q3JGH9_9BASI|nr:hypothetical protein [Austropuccinia psidii MF-1]
MNLAQTPAIALNLGPNPSLKTFPAMLGKVGFYGPGPSLWAQAIWVKKWSHGPPENLALGGSSNPQRPKDPKKTPKGPKRLLIPNPSIMVMELARTQNTQEGPKWPKIQI